MTALFWGSITGVVYAYFGYTAVLSLMSLFRKPKEVHRDKVSRPSEQDMMKSLLDFLKVIYPVLPDYMYTKAATRAIKPVMRCI